MSGGLEITFDLLAATKNEAASDLLLETLTSERSDIRFTAFKAVAKRRSPRLHNHLLARWHTFNERAQGILVESSTRLTQAVRDAILSQDDQSGSNGCDAALQMREYDLIPVLITAAEDKNNPNREKAARAILSLAESLNDEMVTPRDYRNRRDPRVIRRFVVGALEVSINRFEAHQKREIVEAFLILTTCENSALAGILRHTKTKLFHTAMNLLATSPRLGVIRLLLNFLDIVYTPLPCRKVLSSRHDISFLRCFLKKINDGLSGSAKANLKRITDFEWLNHNLSGLLALNGSEQAGLVALVMVSSMERSKAFEVIQFIIHSGQPEGRHAAALILHRFDGPMSQALLFDLAGDSDPIVQAAVVGHLRDTGAPGALPRLIQLLESPDEVVDEALRESLSEFNFGRYLAAFDTLDEEVRASTGSLVKRVDVNALERLADEFNTPSRNRQLRAIDMAIAMDAVGDLDSEIAALGSSPDDGVRGAAVMAMATCDTPVTRAALRDLLMDRSTAVKGAAEQALQMFAAA
jgi:HEAT repeat protein